MLKATVITAFAAGALLIYALMTMAGGAAHPGALFVPPLWAGGLTVGLWVVAMILRLLERIADGVEKLAESKKP